MTAASSNGCHARPSGSTAASTRRIERGFSEFEGWRDQVLAEEEAEHHKLGRKIVAEEHWMRYGVTARRKRNMAPRRRTGRAAQGFPRARRALGAVTMTTTEADMSGKLVARR